METEGLLSQVPAGLDLRPEDLLEQRENWVAINKPGGVLTQAPPGIDSVESRLYRWRQQRAAGSSS